MTKEEAIKYLQQLYPNGGHCWLDEQRIEAIDIAVKALQEEPVSEELEEAARNFSNSLDNIYGSVGEQARNAFKAGAKWQEEHESVDLANAAIEYCGGNKGSDARVRAAFVVGANWQEEQMIDKACEWLKEQDEMVGVSFEEDFIERFKNYMKGE